MPFGVIVDPVFESPDSERIVSYIHCGDSANQPSTMSWHHEQDRF